LTGTKRHLKDLRSCGKFSGRLTMDETEEAQTNDFYEVYMYLETLEEIVRHCKAQLPYEAIGFLAGDNYKWSGRGWISVNGFICGKTRATEVRVEFDEGAMGDIVTALRQHYPGQILVGWYHSHPGYGCFLSPTDIETQRSCFREPYHVALVIDPVQELYEFFKLGDSSLPYRQASFALLR